MGGYEGSNADEGKANSAGLIDETDDGGTDLAVGDVRPGGLAVDTNLDGVIAVEPERCDEVQVEIPEVGEFGFEKHLAIA